jgi:hypothetical protein
MPGRVFFVSLLAFQGDDMGFQGIILVPGCADADYEAK